MYDTVPVCNSYKFAPASPHALAEFQLLAQLVQILLKGPNVRR